MVSQWLGMPFLASVSRVVVVAAKGVTVPGPSAAVLAQHLKRNGIGAQTREVPADGCNGGEVVLAEAAALGADLLIKGAYMHSRLRQTNFSGATSHILGAAEIPVFMSH